MAYGKQLSKRIDKFLHWNGFRPIVFVISVIILALLLFEMIPNFGFFKQTVGLAAIYYPSIVFLTIVIVWVAQLQLGGLRDNSEQIKTNSKADLRKRSTKHTFSTLI